MKEDTKTFKLTVEKKMLMLMNKFSHQSKVSIKSLKLLCIALNTTLQP